MAEILGVGVTHSPSLIAPDELRNYSLTRALRNERIPAERKDPGSWPAAMREEWGDDAGYASALYQRERLAAGFRRVRAELTLSGRMRCWSGAMTSMKTFGRILFRLSA